jgi:hypothetical protein
MNAVYTTQYTSIRIGEMRTLAAVNSLTVFVWAKLAGTATTSVKYTYRLYDWAGNQVGASPSQLTAVVGGYAPVALSLAQKAAPYSARYVPWYFELATTRFYSGDRPQYL